MSLRSRKLVKAFSFGFSVERVAEKCDISVEQAQEIQRKYSSEIEERKSGYE